MFLGKLNQYPILSLYILDQLQCSRISYMLLTVIESRVILAVYWVSYSIIAQYGFQYYCIVSGHFTAIVSSRYIFSCNFFPNLTTRICLHHGMLLFTAELVLNCGQLDKPSQLQLCSNFDFLFMQEFCILGIFVDKFLIFSFASCIT